ncbi:MAG: S46 family peptidase, partial [Alphaproteobacteria bacterium]
AYRELESAAGNRSDLFAWGRDLVRGARERAKPEAERLPAFAPSRLASLQRQVLENYPVDLGIERAKLEFWLLKLREYLTADDPAVRQILGNESPERIAARLATSKLTDPTLRRRLWEGGVTAINASTDPMIVFLRKIDELGVAQQKAWNAEVAAPIEQAQARIGEARFAVYGDTLYPDANFTLRLSYGKVEGWTRNGQAVGPTTNYAGLLERASGDEPYTLAPRWQAAKAKLNPNTVLNFSSSNDILGGNSGSPIVNARGEIIGLIFDGNIYSLGGSYGYDPALNRATSVATVAITEALEKVYGETALVAELTRR